MKVLTLQIKRPYLEAILSGEKTEEYREIRPKNAHKFVIQNPEAEDDDEWLQPVKYDTINFLNGYDTNRPEAIVEVKNTRIELSVDEKGEYITYKEDGEEYIEAQIVYTLGKVLSTKNI